MRGSCEQMPMDCRFHAVQGLPPSDQAEAEAGEGEEEGPQVLQGNDRPQLAAACDAHLPRASGNGGMPPVLEKMFAAAAHMQDQVGPKVPPLLCPDTHCMWFPLPL